MIRNRLLVLNLIVTIAAIVLIVTMPASLLKTLLALWLMFIGPGWALVQMWKGASAHLLWGEQIVIGAVMGLVLTVLGGLGFYAVFGKLTLPMLLIWYGGVTVVGVLGAIFWRKKIPAPVPFGERVSERWGWMLAAVLALAAYFCFATLSYSDWRGDEAEVLLRAIAVLRGSGQPLLSHTKGPAEILVAAAMGLLNGSFDEFAIRLPFAFISWMVVGSVYLLGKQLANRRVGIIAALLMLLNGWLLSHAHTVQYQPLLLWSSVLIIWIYYRYRQTGQPFFLWSGALILSLAALSHYDGAAVGLSVLYLLGMLATERKHWRIIALSLMVSLAIILAFYIPFVFSAMQGETSHYLAKHLGSGQPYNNWGLFYIDWLTNNSAYYLILIAGLILGGVWTSVRQIKIGWSANLLAAMVLAAILFSWTTVADGWVSLAVFIVIISLVFFRARPSISIKILLLWLALPMAAYLFLIMRPRDHYYIFMPPLVLLAAMVADSVFQWSAGLSSKRWVLPSLAGIMALLLGLSFWNQNTLFMRPDLEYMLTYPRHKNSALINDPHFPFSVRIGWGFPYRLGWQTVSELYRSGELNGDWYANDAGNSIRWYTLGAMQNPCYPRYFMLAEHTYKTPSLAVPTDIINQYYSLYATIRVNGETRMNVYEFTPTGSNTTPKIFDEPHALSIHYTTDRFADNPMSALAFHPQTQLTPSRRFKPHPNMLAQLADIYNDPNTVLFQEKVSLLGYDLDTTWAKPGGLVVLTLYWRADTPVFLPYKVFTQVGQEKTWAQADSEPACGNFPTYNWRTGDQFVDRHVISLPVDMPPGEYPIQVGLYEIRSGLRMDILDEAGNPAGTALPLTTLTVSP